MSDELYEGIYRKIYSGWLKGRRINQCSLQSVAVLVNLMLVADDYGNMEGDPVYLARAAFPRREMSGAQIATHSDELVKIGLAMRYEVDGEQYVHLPDFVRFQPWSRNGKRLRRHPLHGSQVLMDKEVSNPKKSRIIQNNPKQSRLQQEHKHEHQHEHEHKQTTGEAATATVAADVCLVVEEVGERGRLKALTDVGVTDKVARDIASDGGIRDDEIFRAVDAATTGPKDRRPDNPAGVVVNRLKAPGSMAAVTVDEMRRWCGKGWVTQFGDVDVKGCEFKHNAAGVYAYRDGKPVAKWEAQ